MSIEPAAQAPDTDRQTHGSCPATAQPVLRRALADFTWELTGVQRYKGEDTPGHHGVTRQVLFHLGELDCEWRYFEVAPGGYSTLERHWHVHAVMVLRGRGRCLVGETIHPITAHDLLTVPPGAWHQFRADDDSPLGFLCLVNRERDRPQRPTPQDLAQLARDPGIAAFIRADG
jgi:quercetin dioxygenase-like cupin family protein